MKGEKRNLLARRLLEDGCDLAESDRQCSAFVLFRESALLGNIEAQVNLANMYLDGMAIKKNQKLAVFWYKKAASKGCAEAAYNLSVLFHSIDDQKHKRWLRIAARLGDRDAIKALKGL